MGISTPNYSGLSVGYIEYNKYLTVRGHASVPLLKIQMVKGSMERKGQGNLGPHPSYKYTTKS